MAYGVGQAIKGLVLLAAAGTAASPWVFPTWRAQLERYIPPGYNPFSPLTVDDPPTFITRYKLKQLQQDPAACLQVLEQAQARGRISYALPGAMGGKCPLPNPVRVTRFGKVALSSSFLASCPMALSSAMFVSQTAAPQAEALLGSRLTRIDHLGSYACRNIYHRENARLSEHATAEALDISAFRLADGRTLSVLKQWPQEGPAAGYLHQVFSESCGFFGNALGPEYNAAHANHFHLGMRGYGICR
ncbi:extensin family protein [Nissabacter sp. SGAir0207]|uniref:extensin-like domain-containing protein n=1 Tax=Nissabacter sp. SGAir0207 TaxID=2126321 RepID=UPI0010CCBA84|nr:extensin family protein [Nissabacter sp. SGAir0207]QCR36067.1 extensin [Nissabacter sp. SGAir0207]